MRLKIIYIQTLTGIPMYPERELQVEIESNADSISKAELFSYLESHNVRPLSERLSYYDSEEDGYIILFEEDIIPLGEAKELGYKELEVCIECDHAPDIKKCLEEYESEIEKMESVPRERNESKKIDIGVLYSLPLYYQKIKKSFTENFVYDYSEELLPQRSSSNDPNPRTEDEKLIQGKTFSHDYDLNIQDYNEESILKDFINDHKLQVKNLPLTKQNLREILILSPSVLYICVEAYYYSDLGRPLLAFESECGANDTSKFGKACMVSENELNHICRDFHSACPVVIVKGCLSETIASIFRNSGFENVIGIHHICLSNYKCSDFLNSFLRELYENKKTVKKAYEASLYYEKEERCCFAHSHTEDCELLKNCTFGKLESTYKKYTSYCCGNNLLQHHDINSKTHRRFLKKFKFKKEIEGNKIQICCCQGGSVDHKMGKNIDLADNNKITANSSGMNDELVDKNAPKVHNLHLFRQREQVYQISMKCFKNHVTTVIGKKYTGKTELLKTVAKYVYARNIFTEGVIYIDFNSIKVENNLLKVLADEMNSPIAESLEMLISDIEEKNMLLIFDNIEYFNDIELLHEFIRPEKTPHIIFATNDRKLIPNDHSAIHKVKDIEEKDTHDYFAFCLRNNERFNQKFLNISNEKDIKALFSSIKEKCLQGSMDTIQELGFVLKSYQSEIKSNKINDYLKQQTSDLNSIPITFLGILTYLKAGIPEKQSQMLKNHLNFELEKPNRNLKYQNYGGIKWIMIRHKKIERVRGKIEDKTSIICSTLKILAILSRGILLALQTTEQRKAASIRSSLLYMNAGINDGIWKPLYQDESNELVESLNAIDLDKFVYRMEANFHYFLKETWLEDITDKSTEIYGDWQETILCYVGILILLSEIDALEQLFKAFFDFSHEQMKATIIDKMKMTQISIEAYKTTNVEKLKSLKKQAKDVLNSVVNYDSEDVNERKEHIAEAYYLIGIIKLKIYRRNPNSGFTKAQNSLLKSIDNFQSQFGKARCSLALLALSEVLSGEDISHSDLVENLNLFNQRRLKHWELRADQVLGLNSQRRNRLAEAHKYFEKAYSLAIEIKAYKVIKMIKNELDPLSQDIIREKKEFTIYFIKSFPLVGHDRNTDLLENFSLLFRQTVTKRLLDLNVNLVFNIGTLQNLINAIENPGKVLHLSSNTPHEYELALEMETGKCLKLNFTDLKDFIGNLKDREGFELVVLALPLSYELGKLFYDELGAKFVIGFDLKDIYHMDENSVQIHCEIAAAIHLFCIDLYESLAKRLGIEEAYEKAKFSLEPYYSRIGREFHPFQFGIESNTKIFPDIVNNTASIDLSPIDNSLKTIKGRERLLIGRRNEIHQILNFLLIDQSHVHLKGRYGFGRTSLLKKLAFNYLTRELYPEGVFYIDLKGIRTIEKINASLQAADVPFKIYSGKPIALLEDLKILVIFDNCDALLSRQKDFFSTHFARLTSNKQVSLIISTLEDADFDRESFFKPFELREMDPSEVRELSRIEEMWKHFKRHTKRQRSYRLVEPPISDLDISNFFGDSDVLENLLN